MDVDGCDGAQHYAVLVSSALGPLGGGNGSALHGSSLAEQSQENGRMPKARKPYTITKTRERWSEEEHQRFVEALRLHGRAWRKIEEHIGTKTAVQIRSHAQKFFNKLEKKKEAGEAPDKDEEDIAIPPPRPKRKPAKPYPRKDGSASASGFTGTSSLSLPGQLAAVGGLGGQQQQHAALAGVALAQPHGLGPLLNGLAASHGAATATAAATPAGGAGGEVTDATVAAVTAAASAAAAAAAAAVVAAAGQEVQTHMQVHPPSCFPFFGMPPSVLAQITPAGVSALDQAALLMHHNATAKAAAAAMQAHDAMDGAAPAALAGAAATLAAAAEGGLGDTTCSDRGLVEATGTTDGTHVSANAQLRGSDGDSACSREIDNQDMHGLGQVMDASWQSKLQRPGLPQLHDIGSGSSPSAAAAAAARALAAGGFDPGQLQWGMPGAPAAAASSDLSGMSAAQAVQLQQMLSHPLLLAAAERHFQQAAQMQAAAAAAAVAAAAATVNVHTNGNGRSSGGGAAASSGGNGRSKSRHTAPSVNSGSTGPPAGSKRTLEVASADAAPAAKKAREVSDTNDGEALLDVPPSSPSIQEKEPKAASQPSNTNGNTSGSNESNDGSKRRQGTVQAEGSNPTHYSSGNGHSVKDSNTATNTNGHTTNGHGNGHSCGNGTSAFKPTGHHHHHHNHSSLQATACGRRANANRDRDEGRSSSDLEGPTQQQLQQQRGDAADEQMEPEVEQAAQRDSAGDDGAVGQLQSLMATLHGMVSGNPAMLQQAYGAAAAAAATAQHMMASAMQQQPLSESAQQHLAAMQPLSESAQQHLAAMQQLQQHKQHAGAGNNGHGSGQAHGFAPWHAAGAAAAAGYGGSSGSFVSSSGLHAQGAAHSGRNSSAAQQAHAQAQLAAAAAGLVGLAGGWRGAHASASGSGSNASSVYAYAGLAAPPGGQHVLQQHGSVAAAAAAAGLQQMQPGSGGLHHDAAAAAAAQPPDAAGRGLAGSAGRRQQQ